MIKAPQYMYICIYICRFIYLFMIWQIYHHVYVFALKAFNRPRKSEKCCVYYINTFQQHTHQIALIISSVAKGLTWRFLTYQTRITLQNCRLKQAHTRDKVISYFFCAPPHLHTMKQDSWKGFDVRISPLRDVWAASSSSKKSQHGLCGTSNRQIICRKSQDHPCPLSQWTPYWYHGDFGFHDFLVINTHEIR